MLAQEPTLTRQAIVDTLCSTAIPLTGKYSTGAYADHQVRCGQVDTAAAVAAVSAGQVSTPEPSPTPTSSPSPEPEPTLEPEPTPSPSSEPVTEPQPVTTTFSGTLNNKTRERSHSLVSELAVATATLTFSKKCQSLTLRSTNATGQSLSVAVPSGGSLEVWHPGGSLTFTVSGCSTSYTLIVTTSVA
jgi:hypothetical protein